MRERESIESRPVWLLLGIGWLFATTTLAHHSRLSTAPSPPERPPLVDLSTSPPRELKRLPGIGPSRANAIARLRWERREGGFTLTDVMGIGPRTEEAVMRWLAEQRPADQTSFGE
jgi:predicted flap endonuclease-1-like 5' DNA nuclease